MDSLTSYIFCDKTSCEEGNVGEVGVDFVYGRDVQIVYSVDLTLILTLILTLSLTLTRFSSTEAERDQSLVLRGLTDLLLSRHGVGRPHHDVQLQQVQQQRHLVSVDS